MRISTGLIVASVLHLALSHNTWAASRADVEELAAMVVDPDIEVEMREPLRLNDRIIGTRMQFSVGKKRYLIISTQTEPDEEALGAELVIYIYDDDWDSNQNDLFIDRDLDGEVDFGIDHEHQRAMIPEFKMGIYYQLHWQQRLDDVIAAMREHKKQLVAQR
ncbi:MAG TPA: hypothetical protein VD928_02510 [Candidatus Paceibacterota bacterium]|nr:hypothetical protein [Candidatus Paceibacterota bacterium]